MQNTKDAGNLLKNIKEGYADLLDFFRCETLNPWITSVVTPVQTVGTVIFRLIKESNKRPRFYFRKMNHEAEYVPKDSDQPLRYILRFILKLHLTQKSSGLFGFFREKLGMNEHLKLAIIQSYQGCKSTNGFTVLQGHNQLNIK